MIPPPYPLSEKNPLSSILRKRLLFVSEYYGSIRHLARVPRLGMMIEGLCQDTSSQPRLSTAIKRMLGGPPSRGTAWNRRAKRHWTVIWKHLFVSKLCIQESKTGIIGKELVSPVISKVKVVLTDGWKWSSNEIYALSARRIVCSVWTTLPYNILQNHLLNSLQRGPVMSKDVHLITFHKSTSAEHI